MSKFVIQMEDKILEKAEGLFLRYGIKSVSMDDLSGELGISKKTLYQTISNKGEIIEKLLRNHMEETHHCMNEICACSSDAIHAILGIGQYVVSKLRCVSPMVIFDLKKYYRELWDAMETGHRNFIFSLIKGNIERGKREGLYRKEVNADIISKLYVGMTTMVSDRDLFPTEKYDQEVLFKQHITYHLHGVLSLKGMQLLAFYQEKE